MDFFEVIEKRRSVRKYTTSKVPEDVIKKAISAALKAPNSSNMQPWEFYWVRSEEKKKLLVEACLNQSAARTAAELVVVVSRMDTWNRNRKLILQKLSENGELNKGVEQYYKKLIPLMYFNDPFDISGFLRFLIFNIAGLFKPMPRKPAFRYEQFEVVTKTTALACQNFMLAITAQGFGTCPMEGFDEARVKRLLNLNGKAHVVMVISVGEVDPEGIWGKQHRVDDKLTVFEV
jgi:nitroreductase